MYEWQITSLKCLGHTHLIYIFASARARICQGLTPGVYKSSVWIDMVQEKNEYINRVYEQKSHRKVVFRPKSENTKLHFRHFFACGVYVQSKENNNSLFDICYHQWNATGFAPPFADFQNLTRGGGKSSGPWLWLILTQKTSDFALK